jgi:hypothetical protein
VSFLVFRDACIALSSVRSVFCKLENSR